jgi:DUF1680 family protein
LKPLLIWFFPQVVFGGAQAVDATRVRLLPGSPFYERQELHRKGYLAALEPDKLLFHYRALAGLPQTNNVRAGYGGWDSGFIRGHMAGHYLSAAARMAAATGDNSFRDKVNYTVTELAKCQDASKTGWLSRGFSCRRVRPARRQTRRQRRGGGAVLYDSQNHGRVAGRASLSWQPAGARRRGADGRLF